MSSDYASFKNTTAGSDGSVAKDQAKGKKPNTPDTIEQMKSQSFQAAKIGYQKDTYVASKKAEVVAVWQITAISDTTASMVEIVDGEAATAQDLPLTTLLQEWRIHKGKVTTKVPKWSYDTNPCSPLSSAAWEIDCMKGAIALASRGIFAEHEGSIAHMKLCINPMSVQVTGSFATGKLKIVGTSQRIERKAMPGSVLAATLKDEKLFICPHTALPINAAGEVNKAPWIAPYWMVKQVDKDANMIEEVYKIDVHGFTVMVPVMRNTTALKEGAKLTVLKRKDYELKLSKDYKRPMQDDSGGSSKKGRR